MKNRELLDILGEIDGELIEDAAPVASTERVVQPKKFNFGWIKPVSIAAFFVIVLGGIIAAKPIYDLMNSSDIEMPDPFESQEEADGDINESPDDGEQEEPPSVNDPPSEGNPPNGEPGDGDIANGEPGDGDIDEGDMEDNGQEPEKEPGKEPEVEKNSGFSELIESIGALKLHETVRYNENKTGFAPPRFTLDDDLLEGIAGVLYMCNGEPVYGLSFEDLGDENVVLEHTGENSTGFAVYKNGYIGVNGLYYDVGAEFTEKIINIVKTDGKVPDGFFWNEEEDCWQTEDSDEDDIYEEIASNADIESERE